ncbi:MAG TPA: hypothetical protein VN643_22425 [Pyrinomonadaceae bacterium]|nr:hypothetical protein [Pyrinomonadaceae bacterium]
MVTLLFTSLIILAFLVVAVYFWQKPANQSKLEAFDDFVPLPQGTEPASLFEASDSDQKLLATASLASERDALLKRAAAGDNTAVDDANKNFDRKVYDEILAELTKYADSDAKLLALLTHVTRNELPVSLQLAQAAIRSWESSPDRGSTPRTLHITALADDAKLYQEVVESALKFWRAGSLTGVSAMELRSLLDGEFWVLSNNTRSSGAGFIMKHALAKARRELEAAARN